MLCINHLTYLGNRYQRPLAMEQGGTISARALVKKNTGTWNKIAES